MSLMKWPGTANKPNKPDLSMLSDDELDDLMVKGGLMEEDALDRQRDSRLLTAVANLPGPPEYCETLAGLMKLRHEGPFPFEAQDLYEKLRARAMSDVEAVRKVAPKVTPSPADVPADKSLAGWLKARWSSADEAVRNALRAVASAVGVEVPLSRTRNSIVGGKDSASPRRSNSGLHLTHDESDPPESPADEESEFRYDGPHWHDELADGWEARDNLYDALHPDEDRGWY